MVRLPVVKMAANTSTTKRCQVGRVKAPAKNAKSAPTIRVMRPGTGAGRCARRQFFLERRRVSFLRWCLKWDFCRRAFLAILAIGASVRWNLGCKHPQFHQRGSILFRPAGHETSPKKGKSRAKP